MGEPLHIDFTIAGEWYWLAAVYRRVMTSVEQGKTVRGGLLTTGARWEVSETASGRPVGSIAFSHDKELGAAIVRVTSATPDYLPYWNDIGQTLQALANDARQLKRRFEPSAEEVVERYYRSRAAGGKLSLKQFAKQYGFNYKYLSSVKSAYDKRGEWGSEVQGSTTENNHLHDQDGSDTM